MFLDEMDSHRCDSRRRPSVTLDAGYVSITSDDGCQTPKIFGLHGNKLICVIGLIITLFLISFINFTVSFVDFFNKKLSGLIHSYGNLTIKRIFSDVHTSSFSP